MLEHYKDLGIYFSESLSWDYHLSFVLLKANQKLTYLRRSIPSETKLSVKCNLVKNLVELFCIDYLFPDNRCRKAQQCFFLFLKHFSRNSENNFFWFWSYSYSTCTQYLFSAIRTWSLSECLIGIKEKMIMIVRVKFPCSKFFRYAKSY